MLLDQREQGSLIVHLGEILLKRRRQCSLIAAPLRDLVGLSGEWAPWWRHPCVMLLDWRVLGSLIVAPLRDFVGSMAARQFDRGILASALRDVV